MEILKIGTVPDEPIFDVVCGVCNSRLRFELREFRTIGTCYAYICPVCKRAQRIDHAELPRYEVKPDE